MHRNAVMRGPSPGAHWGSQYQIGAAIFLSASKGREKTRSHREHGICTNSTWLLSALNICWDVLAPTVTSNAGAFECSNGAGKTARKSRLSANGSVAIS